MSVQETDVVEIGLEIPKFNVDTLYENVPPPLPNKSSLFLFCGVPRSGKTALATSLLVTTKPQKIYNGVFNHVFLFIPETSYNSLSNSPFQSLSKDKIIFDFNEETLGALIRRLEAATKQKQTSLVIIDDFMSNLKDVRIRKSLERLIANRRHLRTSIFLISQNYNAIPLTTRKMITAMFMFKPGNLKELDNIRTELIPLDKDEFIKMFNYVFKPSDKEADKHMFMYIDVENSQIYKKFNRLVIQ
jgi:SpoVK/Ycf46/Vps4 family AAA+-type ATPase